MLHLSFILFNHWFYHPLGACSGANCKGYQWWSGVGSDLGEVTLCTALIALILGFWHQHNCHVKRCYRLKWHPHPVHGHPVCKKHHPHDAADLQGSMNDR